MGGELVSESASMILETSRPAKWRLRKRPISASRFSKQMSIMSRQSDGLAGAVLGVPLASKVRTYNSPLESGAFLQLP
jgi:hypothetical protein